MESIMQFTRNNGKVTKTHTGYNSEEFYFAKKKNVFIPDLSEYEETIIAMNQELELLRTKAKTVSEPKVKTVAKERFVNTSVTEFDILVDQLVDILIYDIVEAWTGDADSTMNQFFPPEKIMIDDWKNAQLSFEAPFVALTPDMFICRACAKNRDVPRRMSGHYCQDHRHLNQDNFSDHAPMVLDAPEYEAYWEKAEDEEEELEYIRYVVNDFFDFDKEEELEDFFTGAMITVKKVWEYLDELEYMRIIYHGVMACAFKPIGYRVSGHEFWTYEWGYIRNLCEEPCEFLMVEDEDFGTKILDDVMPEKMETISSIRKKQGHYQLVKIDDDEERYYRREMNREEIIGMYDWEREEELMELRLKTFDFDDEEDSEFDSEEDTCDLDWETI